MTYWQKIFAKYMLKQQSRFEKKVTYKKKLSTFANLNHGFKFLIKEKVRYFLWQRI